MTTRRPILARVSGAQALLAGVIVAASCGAVMVSIPAMTDQVHQADAARAAATRLEQTASDAMAAKSSPAVAARKRLLLTAIPTGQGADRVLLETQRVVAAAGARWVSSTPAPDRALEVTVDGAPAEVVDHSVTVAIAGDPTQVSAVLRSLSRDSRLARLDSLVLAPAGAADALVTVHMYSLPGQD